jgi:NAD(P)-dependent dehydrogenase (short-subunit alcohol dehydrogenase family)
MWTSAKHALVGMTKTAALEYSARGVRVNAVGPGVIQTPLLDGLAEEARDALINLHPIARLGGPQEVAALACFLLSSKAPFISAR